MNTTHYKLGTRKSLLALAQSGWVARELERLNPGIKIELVGIETKGDKILDKPLSQIEGKEFFTAELDHALLRGEVDFTVHSMKDLSLERPEAFVLGAVPKRELQNDVIVFHETVIERLKAGLPIRIGTSSPRRLTLLPAFLKEALPRSNPNQEPTLQFVEIRGNVNTRISRVHEDESSGRKLDGVVLAFAGLERLMHDGPGSEELDRLRTHTRIMVLPLKPCPSAPAQGALAIETRRDFSQVLAILSSLHHEPTLTAVRAERDVLLEWGGGCHQKLGASALPSGVVFVQGQKPSGEWVNETRGAKRPEQTEFTKIEAQDVFDFSPTPLTVGEKHDLDQAEMVFIAHSRAFSYLEPKVTLKADSKKRIWVSGTRSWFKLAREGVFIEGSVDGQGFEAIEAYRNKRLLKFPSSPLIFLSHSESPPAEGVKMLGTYSHTFREIPSKFHENDSLYWSSGLPFLTLWSKVEPIIFKQKRHACGPGRTAQQLGEKLQGIGVAPTILTME
jgi:hydroxymethylbilane synthase